MDPSNEVTVRLPVPPDQAVAFLARACAVSRLRFASWSSGSLRISPVWRPGRVYIERPTFVGVIQASGSRAEISGHVNRSGRWFPKIYLGGVTIAAAVAFVIWFTTAVGLRHRPAGDPGASLLLIPLMLLVIGIVVVRVGRVDSDRQAADLLQFLASLNEDSTAP